MSYYQGSGYDAVEDRPMLGPIEPDLQPETSNGNGDSELDYDPDYDAQVNRLLDEFNEELSPTHSEKFAKNNDFLDNNSRIEAPSPSWYKQKLQNKVRETKDRLGALSNTVCFYCSSTRDYIQMVERDHAATFCKMDHPRNPSFNKPWTNSWKFDCTIKCRDAGKPYHDHTADCESIVMEHVGTGVSLTSSNICHNEFPNFVMDAVQLFEDFAIETIGTVPIFDVKGTTDKAYEKSMWTGIKLVVRSNHKDDLMLIVRGKGISSLIPKLKKYFYSGPGRYSNVISVFCLDQKWSRKKGLIEPVIVTGLYTLRDRIGPFTIEYKPKINIDFNSVEVLELSKIIQDYAGLTVETTLLDVGCNFGVLSLLMSDKCEKVIGVNTMYSLTSDIKQAEELKKMNGIENVMFMACDPDELLTKCATHIKRCISVAVLNLSSAYGKNKKVVQALRDMPSIWRVIVYGAFTKEFHKSIVTLVSEDDLMGERYLPVQGCILDKSPSIDTAFDIVILFERKSLIQPKIELLAAGPTVNIKNDLFTLELQEEKPKVQVDRIKKFEGPRKKSRKSPPTEDRKSDYPVPKLNSWQEPPSRREHHSSARKSTNREEKRPEARKHRSSPPSDTRKSRDSSASREDGKVKKEILPQQSTDQQPSSSYRSPSPRVKIKSRDSSVSREDRKIKKEILPQQSTDQQPSSSYRSPSPRVKIKSRDSSASREDGKVKKEILPQQSTDQQPSSSYRSPSPSVKIKSLDSSATRDDGKVKKEILPQQSTDQQPSSSYPLLSVRKEFQFTFLSPPRERLPSPPTPSLGDRFPSPPPPPPPTHPTWFHAPQTNEISMPTTTDSNMFDGLRIKEEQDAGYCSPSTTTKSASQQPTETDVHDGLHADCPLPVNVKSEPMELEEDKEVDGSNGQNDGILTASIKSELVTPSCFPSSSTDNKCEDIPLPPVTVKSEPAELQVDSSQHGSVKNEPIDMDISPNTNHMENMETPVHKARVLNDIENMETPIHKATSTPFTASNIITLNGFGFSLQANKSYLNMKKEPEATNKAAKVKTEPDHSGANEEEVKIIEEKKSDKPKPRVRVKTVEEIIKVKTELKEKDNLSDLYEKRQKILDQLNEEKGKKDLPRSYKRHSSPTRSTSRRYDRSPSSPRRRYRSPTSPYRHRSPSSKRRRRSPPLPNARRRRRSPSPPSRVKREPRSPDRVKRKSISPASVRRRDGSGRRFFDRQDIYGRTHARRKRSRSRSRSPRRQ